jgi:hypothetical protein
MSSTATPELWLVIPMLVGNSSDLPEPIQLNDLRKAYFDYPSQDNLSNLLDYAHVTTQMKLALSTDLNSRTALFAAVQTLHNTPLLAPGTTYPVGGCGGDVRYLNMAARNLNLRT